MYETLLIIVGASLVAVGVMVVYFYIEQVKFERDNSALSAARLRHDDALLSQEPPASIIVHRKLGIVKDYDVTGKH